MNYIILVESFMWIIIMNLVFLNIYESKEENVGYIGFNLRFENLI